MLIIIQLTVEKGNEGYVIENHFNDVSLSYKHPFVCWRDSCFISLLLLLLFKVCCISHFYWANSSFTKMNIKCLLNSCTLEEPMESSKKGGRDKCIKT